METCSTRLRFNRRARRKSRKQGLRPIRGQGRRRPPRQGRSSPARWPICRGGGHEPDLYDLIKAKRRSGPRPIRCCSTRAANTRWWLRSSGHQAARPWVGPRDHGLGSRAAPFERTLSCHVTASRAEKTRRPRLRAAGSQGRAFPRRRRHPRRRARASLPRQVRCSCCSRARGHKS